MFINFLFKDIEFLLLATKNIRVKDLKLKKLIKY